MRRLKPKAPTGGVYHPHNEPLPNESARDYEFWLAFLKLGPDRTERAVAKQFGVSSTIVVRCAKKNFWAERIYNYLEDGVKSLPEIQRKEAEDLTDKVKRVLSEILDKLSTAAGNARTDDLKITDVANSTLKIVQAARLMSGQSTANVAVATDLTKVGDDDLVALRTILAKGTGPAPDPR